MKIIKYIRIAVLTGVVSLMGGCNSWLDMQPDDQVTEDQLYESVSGFRLALNGIYIDLNTTPLYGGDLLVDGIEVLAQRYKLSEVGDKDLYNFSQYDYTSDYAKDKIALIWENSYKLIANCNKLLQNAEKREHLFNEVDKGLIVGEAMALRAMLHFNLLNLFGPVYSQDKEEKAIPYNTQYLISATSILPASQVVEKILNDLSEAERLLASDPIIKKGTMAKDSEDGLNLYTYRNQRLNYYAVKALQARVYQYAGRKGEALAAAKAVTAVQSQYFPFTTYSEVLGNSVTPDRIFSKELVFCLTNSKRNDIFDKKFSPELIEKDVLAPKEALDNLFGALRDKDYRYATTWLKSPKKEYKTFHKYEKLETRASYDNIIPLIRISEMYYIIAESTEDPTEALNAINTVMKNRGLSDYDSSIDLAKVLHEEYQKEFWGEGQLFYYYKRNFTQKIYCLSSKSEIEMTKAKYMLPLPKSETDYH